MADLGKQQNDNNSDEKFDEFFDLITKATVAEISGEYLSSIHLYLAAYQTAKNTDEETLENALLGLHNAWKMALGLRERPLCEHIYSILSRHLSDEDIAPYSDELHNLMLQKLEDIGVPLKEVQGDFDVDDFVGKIKDYVDGMLANNPKLSQKENKSSGNLNNADIAKQIKAAQDSSSSTISGDSTQNDKSSIKDKNVKKESANSDNLKNDKTSEKKIPANIEGPGHDTYVVKHDVLRYRDLVGYDSAISYMRSKGLGMNVDNQYNQLVKKLNAEHGLDRVAFSDSIVFRSKSRTDAKVFMEATAGETGMPAIHMHVDENISGRSVLCMLAPADGGFKLNPGRTGFNGKGILLLEDVDLWDFPAPEEMKDEGMGAFLAAQISRGVTEIMNLIDIAIEDPNIIVMATVDDNPENDSFLRNIFNSYHVVDINFPTEMERAAIWTGLADDHPSLRAFSLEKLVKYSENMSRYDINVAVHDALEDAYKQGLKNREYVPLTLLNITEKLAEHQPLESSEYKKLEDAATEEFKKSLENIDDILK